MTAERVKAWKGSKHINKLFDTVFATAGIDKVVAINPTCMGQKVPDCDRRRPCRVSKRKCWQIFLHFVIKRKLAFINELQNKTTHIQFGDGANLKERVGGCFHFGVEVGNAGGHLVNVVSV